MELGSTLDRLGDVRLLLHVLRAVVVPQSQQRQARQGSTDGRGARARRLFAHVHVEGVQGDLNDSSNVDLKRLQREKRDLKSGRKPLKRP